jgi:hypothetical protein
VLQPIYHLLSRSKCFPVELQLPGRGSNPLRIHAFAGRTKGGVEGGVGRFRRNQLVPVPKVDSYDALNRLLLDGCARDDLRSIAGRSESVLSAWSAEVPRLRALPAEAFECHDVEQALVNGKGCAVVRQNFYSAPVRLGGREVEAHVHANRVDLHHSGKCVARHVRLWGKYGFRVELDHYLELVRERPRAFGQSLPLKQARERGGWPAVYDTLWGELRARHGDSGGTRQLVDVLMLHRGASPAEVEMAVRLGLKYGCHDAGAIAVLLRQLLRGEPEPVPLAELGELACYEHHGWLGVALWPSATFLPQDHRGG